MYCIILVNDIFLTSVTNDEAINILRNAGSEINLTDKHYKSEPAFLRMLIASSCVTDVRKMSLTSI